MANNKSIQILRGGPNYDPSTSDQVLLDGQPFYSKKDGKLRIGKQDKKIRELDDVAALNLNRENGSVSQKDQIWNNDSLWDGAEWSLIKGQKVPGANASGFQSAAFGGTRYDYINYGPDGTDGDSAANGSTVNSSANAYNRTPTSAEGNQSFAVGGSSHAYGDWAVAMGKDVTSSATAALAVNEGTQALHPHSLAAGFYTKTGAQYQAVFGKYNEGKSNTVFEVGYGSSSTRKNVFEVLMDGRAKVYAAPVEDNDVVRKKDISTTIDQDFFNSLY